MELLSSLGGPGAADLAARLDGIRLLLAHLPTGVVVAEAETGRVVFVTPAVGRVMGEPFSTPAGFTAYMDRFSCRDESGRALSTEEWPISRARRGEVVTEQLLEVDLPDGRRVWLECRAAPVYGPSGAVEAAIVLFEDVSEKREARQREAESEAFRQSVLEGLSESGLGFIVSDGRRVLAVNDAVCAMTGRTREELVGLDTTLLVVPEERQEGAERQERRVAQPHSQSFRCTFLRPDGTRVPAHVIGKALRGDPPRFVAIVRDLTDEERARSELDSARRQVARSEKLSALGSLVSGVAHEIRTPLTYLQNNLYLLQRRIERALDAQGDARRELAGALDQTLVTLEAGERIARLVDELRRFTRLAPGDRRVDTLAGSTRDAVALFEATHRGTIDVRAAIESTPDVVTDALDVQQVVLNLLENAAEASPPGGQVRVRVVREERGARLEIEDDGPGIPTEVAERMYDPFFTTKPQGTGLGLSIVKRIAETSGAQLACETRPGRTRFTLLFPARGAIATADPKGI